MNRYLASLAALVLLVSACCGQPPETPEVPQLVPVLKQSAPLINDVDQAAVATHPATPFIETSTFAIADIDITKLDVNGSVDWLRSLMRFPEDNDTKQPIEMLQGSLQTLKTAGVQHIYVTASTRSMIDGGPLVIIPCEDTQAVRGVVSPLLQVAPQGTPQTVHVGDKVVLVGAKPAIDRVIGVEGTSRADLILPLNDPARLDHAIIISLPAESRDDLAAMWPDRLPENAPIQFSPRGVAQDIVRVVITFRLPAEPQVVVRIATGNEAAAGRVKELIEKSFALAPEAKKGMKVELNATQVLVNASPDALKNIVGNMLGPARQKATMTQTTNSLKQLGLAIHNYAAVNKHLPPRCLTDRDGKPLHSWMVSLLPYLEQRALYNAVKLDQPWDSKANKALLDVAVGVFTENDAAPFKTRFRVPIYPGSLWHGDGPPRTFRDVIDGTSNTIAVIHAPADAAVQWSNPEPWVISEQDPMSSIFGDRDQVSVLFLDGSARVFSKEELDNEKLKKLLTYAGRDVIE